MSSLRDEIRAILREELTALRAEMPSAPEPVQIRSGEDVNRFARSLIERARDPAFAAGVTSGAIRFTLAQTPAPIAARPIVNGPAKPAGHLLDQKLVTESDIAQIGSQTLRVGKQTRLTPLAQDEARRKGIRIERIET